jgi:hypothetical protein
MIVKRLRDYSLFAWLVSFALAFWAYRFSAYWSWLHELGHVLFGGGYIVSNNNSMVYIDWFGSQAGGYLGPMLIYSLAGRIARRWFPPAWAVGAILAQINEALFFPSSGDFPAGSPIHVAISLGIFAIALYNLFKPTRVSRRWKAIRDEFLAQIGMKAGDHECPTRPNTSRLRDGERTHQSSPQV